MAAIEFPTELQKRIAETGPVDLIIGVTGPTSVSDLCAKARTMSAVSRKVVMAYPGAQESEYAHCFDGPVQLAPLAISTQNSDGFWIDISAMQRSFMALAAQWGARACLVVHNDLAALEPETVRLFTAPILHDEVDLMMPVYVQGKYEGLITKCLLSPFSRALYGRRVRFPLAFDFCAGSKVFAQLADRGANHSQGSHRLLWPSNEIAMNTGRIGQALATIHHPLRSNFGNLTAMLSEFAGALFLEAERNAAYWQRVRNSEAVPRYGNPSFPNEAPEQIDSKPMVESFVRGSRDLEEVWRLVLPPATMLELKRLARLDPDNFRMPDLLWARILYDFALAHRMRRLSRAHMLGALTPLYLGWVASYTQEVANATGEEADRRVGLLGKAFEEQKPYFVSRWRWPERVS